MPSFQSTRAAEIGGELRNPGEVTFPRRAFLLTSAVAGLAGSRITKQEREIAPKLAAEFVVRETLQRRRPNLRCRCRITAVPVSTAKIEHRYGIVRVERKRPFVGVDRLSPPADAGVSRSQLKPAHGVRLNDLGLLQQQRHALIEPLQRFEGNRQAIAVFTARQVIGLAKAALRLRPVLVILRPVAQTIPRQRGVFGIDVADVAIKFLAELAVALPDILPLCASSRSSIMTFYSWRTSCEMSSAP